MYFLDKVQAFYSINKSSIESNDTVYCTIKSGSKSQVVTLEHLEFIAKYCDCTISEVKLAIDKMNSVPEQNENKLQTLLNEKAKLIKGKN